MLYCWLFAWYELFWIFNSFQGIPSYFLYCLFLKSKYLIHLQLISFPDFKLISTRKWNVFRLCKVLDNFLNKNRPHITWKYNVNLLWIYYFVSIYGSLHRGCTDLLCYASDQDTIQILDMLYIIQLLVIYCILHLITTIYQSKYVCLLVNINMFTKLFGKNVGTRVI